MRTIKILLFFFIFLTSKSLFAQLDTLRVMTSAVCDQCKEIIEHDLSFEKGVKRATLDLDTKMVTVVFNPQKTSAAKILTAITKSGYDADSLKADAKAFRRLPDCCKKPHSD